MTLCDLLGSPRQPNDPLEQRHKDLARSAQVIYEEAFFSLLQALHARHPSDNLALAGGCAMNSVANGKVYRETPFKRMYLPAAAGDAGGAIGAAAMVAANLGGTISPPKDLIRTSRQAEVRNQASNVNDRQQKVSGQRSAVSRHDSHFARSSPAAASAPSAFQHVSVSAFQESVPLSASRPSTLDFSLSTSPFTPYLGPSFNNSACWQVLQPKRSQLSDFSCQLLEISDASTICHRTAQAIADGKVVGWFQGRMEWGPRALGNRSILCDPRRADMKEILNAKIKRRESFRPFAPSILREAVSEWFEQEDDVPYMMEVFQVRPEKRALIPAVTHVDGSGRLQTVHRELNPLYHQLISDFCRLTSIPLVLNTSFNENEPVVCRPEEALDCFLRTRMDVLVLGSFFVERQSKIEDGRSEIGNETELEARS